MRKLLLILVVLFCLSCADEKTINGVTYRPYGLLNDKVLYEVSGWAVFSGVVFFECIVPPIYVFGYNLFEPVGLKNDQNPELKGVVK